MTGKDFDCSINFEPIASNVELTERGPQDEKGYWTSTPLFDNNVDDMSMYVSVDDDNDVEFYVSVFHAENEETSRAFHAHFKWKLDEPEVARLRDFLGMVSKWQLTENGK